MAKHAFVPVLQPPPRNKRANRHYRLLLIALLSG